MIRHKWIVLKFQINDNIPSSLSMLLSAPVLNSTTTSTDDADNETPIVSYCVC